MEPAAGLKLAGDLFEKGWQGMRSLSNATTTEHPSCTSCFQLSRTPVNSLFETKHHYAPLQSSESPPHPYLTEMQMRQQYLPGPECWELDLSARRYFQEAKGAIQRSSPPDRLSQHAIGQKASKHHRSLSYQYISSGSRSRALNHTLLSNYCQCGCNSVSPCMEMPADHQILL
jgi:hypothetical protein